MRWLVWVPLAIGFGFVSAVAEDKVGRDISVPQLTVFDPYIGDWQYTMKSADGTKMTGGMKTEWIHAGKLVRQSWTMESTVGRPTASGENVMTYDVHKNMYRQWSFSSSGLTTVSTGTWDADKKVMTWTGRDSMQNELIARSEFSDRDSEKFRIVVKSPEGATLADIEGTATRK